MVLFKGKRGVSPLIATILLIAFAVALGAVIMQFGEAAVVGVCGSNIVLGANAQCTGSGDSKNIEFSISNQGSEEISSIKVEAIGSSSTNAKEFTNKITVKGNSQGSLPYSSTIFGQLKNLRFVPSVGSTVCTENAKEIMPSGC